jgi:hypothetical protein
MITIICPKCHEIFGYSLPLDPGKTAMIIRDNKLEAVAEAAEWHLEVSEYLNFLYDEDEHKWLPVQYYDVHTICRQAVNDLAAALRALKGDGNEGD